MNSYTNKILVTGSVGFIGSSLCIKLLERGNNIIGIDNHNDYYDPKIKEARLQRLTTSVIDGVTKFVEWYKYYYQIKRI